MISTHILSSLHMPVSLTSWIYPWIMHECHSFHNCHFSHRRKWSASDAFPLVCNLGEGAVFIVCIWGNKEHLLATSKSTGLLTALFLHRLWIRDLSDLKLINIWSSCIRQLHAHWSDKKKKKRCVLSRCLSICKKNHQMLLLLRKLRWWFSVEQSVFNYFCLMFLY